MRRHPLVLREVNELHRVVRRKPGGPFAFDNPEDENCREERYIRSQRRFSTVYKAFVSLYGRFHRISHKPSSTCYNAIER